MQNDNLVEIIREHLKELRERQELMQFSRDTKTHIATLSLFANDGRKSPLLSTIEPVLAKMIVDAEIDMHLWALFKLKAIEERKAKDEN